MKLVPEQLKLLGLSNKEIKVLDSLRYKKNTPLQICKATNVSRPAIYEILTRLRTRGLVKTNIIEGKKYWSQAKERDLEQSLYETKKQLFNISDGTEEVYGLSDSTVILYRGKEAIKKLFLKDLLTEHKGQKLHMTVAMQPSDDWEKIMGLEGINEFNRLVKKNEMITELISPEGWFQNEFARLGEAWAKEFIGRAAIANEIDGSYFNHHGQIWMFKNSVYLISMNEELVIEIRNSEIQKLVRSFYDFIQDNSRKYDVNSRLRELLDKNSRT